jgi:hypothetical protein
MSYKTDLQTQLAATDTRGAWNRPMQPFLEAFIEASVLDDEVLASGLTLSEYTKTSIANTIYLNTGQTGNWLSANTSYYTQAQVNSFFQNTKIENLSGYTSPAQQAQISSAYNTSGTTETGVSYGFASEAEYFNLLNLVNNLRSEIALMQNELGKNRLILPYSPPA